jgi:hypothetical protein
MYDSDVWQPSDEIVTDLFFPFEDHLLLHTQDDLQSSLDTYHFEDADLFHEDFHSLCIDFERHQVAARPKQSKDSTTKQKYSQVEILVEDLQMKK